MLRWRERVWGWARYVTGVERSGRAMDGKKGGRLTCVVSANARPPAGSDRADHQAHDHG